METANTDASVARRSRMLRIHFLGFAGVSIVLLSIDLSLFAVRWFHWPVMAWGAVLGTHFLYCKSLAVDDAWVEKRTNKIRDKSYDLGHIRAIED